jgi:hypothetical protein
MSNIQEFIQKTKEINLLDRYHPLQLNVDGDRNKEFMEYLISISDIVRLEELTGIQRQRTEKDKDFILSQIDSDAFAGIKVVHFPIYDFHEYDKWEGGYIEGCLRTMSRVDYFIWTYAKIEHLEDLLTKFKDSFRTYREFNK